MTINNNNIFNAALAGASGGVQEERQISDSSASSYAAIRTQIVAFATAVDAAIGPTTVSGIDAELMQSICQAVTARRFLVGQTPSNLSVLATAIAAFWTEMQGSLQPATGGFRNLRGVFYVDPSIAITGDGNIESPFKTIQEAVDASVADTGLATIYLAPGSYGGQAVNTTGWAGAIIGLAGVFGIDTVGAITGDGALFLANIASQNGGITTPATLTLFNVSVLGTVNCGTLNVNSTNSVDDCTISGDCTVASNFNLYNYSVGNITAAGGFARNVGFGAINSSGPLDLGGCNLNDITIAADTTAKLVDCHIENGATFTGGDVDSSIYNLDAITNQSFRDNGTILTTAHRSVIGVAASDTLSFVVSGISAGGTAYFNAVIPTTSVLFEILQDSPIAVNPKTDLAAAGASAGFLVSYRVSAPNTVRICLRGNIADATYDFVVTRL